MFVSSHDVKSAGIRGYVSEAVIGMRLVRCRQAVSAATAL